MLIFSVCIYMRWASDNILMIYWRIKLYAKQQKLKDATMDNVQMMIATRNWEEGLLKEGTILRFFQIKHMSAYLCDAF